GVRACAGRANPARRRQGGPRPGRPQPGHAAALLLHRVRRARGVGLWRRGQPRGPARVPVGRPRAGRPPAARPGAPGPAPQGVDQRVQHRPARGAGPRPGPGRGASEDLTRMVKKVRHESQLVGEFNRLVDELRAVGAAAGAAGVQVSTGLGGQPAAVQGTNILSSYPVGPISLSGTVNDYDPGNTSWLQISPAAGTVVTGFQGGASG